MPKIVIHVGPSKTASTTLQKILLDYSHSFSGYTYPDIGRLRPDGGQHNIAYQLRNDSRFDASVSGLESLSQRMANGEDLFLSSEDFSLHRNDTPELFKLFKRFDYQAEFLFFVRDPIERLNSMYTQSVKTLTFAGDINTFADNFKNNMDQFPYSNFLGYIRDLGYEIQFVPFVSGKMDEIIHRVIQYYGFQGDLPEISVLNRSPSPEEVYFFLKHQEILKGVNYWKAFIENAKRFDLNHSYFGFDQETYLKLVDYYTPEFDKMRTISFISHQNLFFDNLFSRTEFSLTHVDESKFPEYEQAILSDLNLS